MDDFTVETKGLCFLCLNKVSAQSDPPCSTYSLQILSRYLKMDMRKVFDEKGPVPHNLLAKVEKAKLKVELCEGCVHLNEGFSKVYRQLEKIEMEVASYVDIIHRKLLGAKEKINNPDEILYGKRKIAEVLRNEARLKCSQKLMNAAVPKIKVKKLSTKQITSEKDKIKRKNARDVFTRGIEGSTRAMKDEVKKEHSISDDDAGNDYFDDFDVQTPQSDELPSFESAVDITAGNSRTGLTSDAPTPQANVKSAISHFKIDVDPETGHYKCSICQSKFSAKGSCQAHYKSVHLKVRYKCTICGIEFAYRSDYNRHHRSVHLGIRFKCRVCDKTFPMKFQLTHHQKTSSCCKTENSSKTN